MPEQAAGSASFRSLLTIRQTGLTALSPSICPPADDDQLELTFTQHAPDAELSIFAADIFLAVLRLSAHFYLIDALYAKRFLDFHIGHHFLAVAVVKHEVIPLDSQVCRLKDQFPLIFMDLHHLGRGNAKRLGVGNVISELR